MPEDVKCENIDCLVDSIVVLPARKLFLSQKCILFCHRYLISPYKFVLRIAIRLLKINHAVLVCLNIFMSVTWRLLHFRVGRAIYGL